MDTFGDLAARERRSDDPALAVPDSRGYDYHRFLTTAWKTGNFLRHLGVREGATVGIVSSPAAPPVLGFLGSVLLGGGVRFDPPREVEARVLLAPGDSVGEYDLPPGGQFIAYGEAADDPRVSQFESDVWSENPVFPETPVPPETTALAGEPEMSHADLLDAGRAVAEERHLEPGDSVVIRAPLSDPRAVAAGVVAPLVAGAEIGLDAERTGDFSVAVEDAPEKEVARVADVPLSFDSSI
ncbi:long-chain fatty acid--CoA ligase [Haladaptatus halobius]|uniref:long-chain fatty acid--CoA ligase n=1 Tax=Haladaptatus halobius TaxID=2884875 RepID=UPI001D0B1600|nr:long-chain fatty acid--CoA ligase [Haladaptatus halobius]